jgi:hypothetical protein
MTRMKKSDWEKVANRLWNHFPLYEREVFREAVRHVNETYRFAPTEEEIQRRTEMFEKRYLMLSEWLAHNKDTPELSDGMYKVIKYQVTLMDTHTDLDNKARVWDSIRNLLRGRENSPIHRGSEEE